MQYSITNFNEVKSASRFDAEYYSPEYLAIIKIIKQKHHQFIIPKKLGLTCTGSAFYPALEPYYGQGNIPFIRVSDVNENIYYEQTLTIPKEILNQYKTLNIGSNGDIVITKGGSIARAGLLLKKSALTRDLISFNTSILSESEYIFYYIYCLTDFYKKQLIRSASMTAQPHLTITLVRNIPLFNPTKTFKNSISKLYKKLFFF